MRFWFQWGRLRVRHNRRPLSAVGGIAPAGGALKPLDTGVNFCVGGTGAGLSGFGGLDGGEGKLGRDERYPGGAL